MWWVFKSQTEVVFNESTLEKSQEDPWRDQRPWQCNGQPHHCLPKGPALLSSMVESKAALFVLGNLPSGGFGLELGGESKPKGVGDYGEAPHFPCLSLVCRTVGCSRLSTIYALSCILMMLMHLCKT